MGTRLVIIRHGESLAHIERRVASHDCRGLTERGISQARLLAERLAHTGELDDAIAIHTSLMRRAAQTAEILAPAIAGGGLTPTANCCFCERHHGEADGLSWEEYEARFGGLDPAVDRHRAEAAGEECLADVVARVGRGLAGLSAPGRDGAMVVVAHGGVVGAALEVLLGCPVGSVSRYVHFTAITEFEWDDRSGRWWLTRLNDAGHLALIPDAGANGAE